MNAIAQITTADELFQTADLGRCELVRGEIIMMSPAGSRHGAIALRIGSILLDFVNARGLGVVLGAETGFLIARDPDTVLAPDVAFVRRERVGEGLPEGFFPGSPDLAVEVLSPSDRASEVFAKTQRWLEAGTHAVWIVDPQTQTVTVHPNRCEAKVLERNDTLAGDDLLPEFGVSVAELFSI
jgi:Uma2 family endonuclease